MRDLFVCNEEVPFHISIDQCLHASRGATIRPSLNISFWLYTVYMLHDFHLWEHLYLVRAWSLRKAGFVS